MTQRNSAKKELVYKRIDSCKEVVTADPNRLHYHIMPPVGLLNDPNGFVFFKGKYHVFYQWNPFETKHGIKYWGHYISDDLVHWETAPIALAPDQWFDKDGCYSGSAVVKNDKLYVFYTGNVKDESNNRESYQCMAISENGITFVKKGPVIHVPEGYTAHFRDPKVFCKNGLWYMVIGAQTSKGEGEVVLYSSSDLENWDFLGPLAGSNKNGLHDFGYMWECPDLFELGNRDILIISPQGLKPEGYKYNNIYQAGYFSGKVEYTHVTYDHGTFTELDRGFDFYAPQTAIDHTGRRLLFGWMGNAEEGESSHPTTNHHWIHALTLPRQLKWRHGRLFQYPAEELKLLRKNEMTFNEVNLSEQETKLPGLNGNVFELNISIKEWKATSFSVVVGKNNKISYNQPTNTFSFQRKSFNGDNLESRHCLLKELKSIRVFKDTSSIEIFVNEGEEVFSSRVFDEISTNDGRIYFFVNGMVTADIQKWDLNQVCK
ncbi:sucrose-6-phosphate hydrolase [Virgibacillus sp. C22-A2]|uniref:Sucrose-6-phosphate hydrolase n=1 Tax=Virgibacillus tibetensis TaxID=3042313 RepID=A0ABU6KFR9_9BACI|nr:sucrose-6-phosphate hydrolase [Virgibacillus sp. C22-A2]